MPYHLVTDKTLGEFQDRLGQATGRIGVDTETNGLRPDAGHRIIGASVSLGPTREDDHYYLPVRHLNYDNLPLGSVKAALSPLLTDPGRAKVFHNAKFDLKMFRADGFPDAVNVHDTILMAHLLEPDNGAGNLGLKTLCETVLKEKPEDQKVLQMHILSRFPTCTNFMEKLADADPNVVCQYACSDTRLCLRVDGVYYPQILADPKLVEIYEREIEVMMGLVATELRGVPVTLEGLKGEAAKLAPRLDALLAEIRTVAKMPLLNPHSNGQIFGLLTDVLGLKLPDAKRTATGKISLRQETLEAVSHPVAQKIAEYRRIYTLKETFFEGLQPWVTAEGFVHPNLNQTGTPHARFSCREPNLQNIPPDARLVFGVRPGYRSWRWDYSQIEMRVFAHYSGDTLLIEGYKTPGFDIHASVAAELGIERKYAKAVNFLIIYGGGAAKLASNVGCSDEKARAFLEKYYSRLPGVKALRNQAKRFIETRVIRDPADTSKVIKWGYVKDLFGRPYHLPSDKSYRAVNRLVAGCAANLMKHGMARVFGLIEAIRKEHGPDAACLLINIHDEIEIEIRRDVPAESVWVPRITTAMEDFPQFKVPIRCEVKMTETTWNEAKPWYS